MIRFRKKSDKRVKFSPKYRELPFIPHRGAGEIERKKINNSRRKGIGDATGSFYVNLYSGMFGGKVLKENEKYTNGNPLYHKEKKPLDLMGFEPDVLDVRGPMRKIITEVKATAKTRASPWFSFRQFTNYSRDFLQDPYSYPQAAVFTFGNWKPEKLWSCDKQKRKGYDCKHETCSQECLIDRLCNSTRNVVLMPHNLWSFLMMVSSSNKMDQTNSQSPIDFETYARPRGSWLTLLHKHWQNPNIAIEKIVENAKKVYIGTEIETKKRMYKKRDFLLGLSTDDFLLGDLFAEQFSSSYFGRFYALTRERGEDNPAKAIRVRGYDGSKVKKDFTVTIYQMPDIEKWRRQFGKNRDMFCDAIGIRDIFRHQEKQTLKRIEAARQKQMEEDEKPIEEDEIVLEKPKDNIPF